MKNKKITCEIQNDPARNWILITFSLISIIPIFFSQYGLWFIILVLGLIFYGISKFILKIRVTLEFIDGNPRITMKGIASIYVFESPFHYSAEIKTYPITRFSTQTYFVLKIDDKYNPLFLCDPIEFADSTDGIPIESKTKTGCSYMGILRTVDENRGKIWEIFQALEEYSKGSDTDNNKLESPFKGE